MSDPKTGKKKNIYEKPDESYFEWKNRKKTNEKSQVDHDKKKRDKRKLKDEQANVFKKDIMGEFQRRQKYEHDRKLQRQKLRKDRRQQEEKMEKKYKKDIIKEMNFAQRKKEISFEVDNLLYNHFKETANGIDILNKEEERKARQFYRNPKCKSKKDKNLPQFLLLLDSIQETAQATLQISQTLNQKIKKKDYTSIIRSLSEFNKTLKDFISKSEKYPFFVNEWLNDKFIKMGEALNFFTSITKKIMKDYKLKEAYEIQLMSTIALIDQNSQIISAITQLRPKVKKLKERAEPYFKFINPITDIEIVTNQIFKIIDKYCPDTVDDPNKNRIKIIKKPADDFVQAMQYFYGSGKIQNYKQCLNKLMVGKGVENLRCIGFMAWMYQEGQGVKQDPIKAQGLYQEAAELGHAESQYRLAQMILDQTNENTPAHTKEQSQKDALDLLMKAQVQNHPGALTLLGMFYEKGKNGLKKNTDEAVRLYTIAATEYENPEAMNRLGVLFYQNDVNQQEFRETQKASQKKLLKVDHLDSKVIDLQHLSNHKQLAFYYFKQAAEQGFSNALTNLGRCYMAGDGCVKNVAEAIRCFEEASLNGDDSTACFYLGHYFLRQGSQTSKHDDYAQAASFFRKAIEYDPKSKESHYYMGFLFQNGFGVEKDLKTAMTYYNKSAEFCFSKAFTKLGQFAYSGYSGTQDVRLAKKMFQKAFQLGDTSALNELGVLYEKEKNYKEAYKYYFKGKEEGNIRAIVNLGLMFDFGNFVEANQKKAMLLYKMAADRGDQTATKILAFKKRQQTFQIQRHHVDAHLNPSNISPVVSRLGLSKIDQFGNLPGSPSRYQGYPVSGLTMQTSESRLLGAQLGGAGIYSGLQPVRYSQGSGYI